MGHAGLALVLEDFAIDQHFGSGIRSRQRRRRRGLAAVAAEPWRRCAQFVWPGLACEAAWALRLRRCAASQRRNEIRAKEIERFIISPPGGTYGVVRAT